MRRWAIGSLAIFGATTCALAMYVPLSPWARCAFVLPLGLAAGVVAGRRGVALWSFAVLLLLGVRLVEAGDPPGVRHLVLPDQGRPSLVYRLVPERDGVQPHGLSEHGRVRGLDNGGRAAHRTPNPRVDAGRGGGAHSPRRAVPRGG